MPKSFDPALAAAPPETDVVRAIFEGLTETDPKTLQPTPGVAEKWTHSEDFKTWTFHLRKDAKWSNGKAVTAEDFARSWKRLAEMGEKVPHYKLLSNIIGMQPLEKEIAPKVETQEIDLISKQSANQNVHFFRSQSNSGTAANAAPKPNSNSVQSEIKTQVKPEEKSKSKEKKETKFGVEAIDDYMLKVSLIKPDKNFPALASNPILRPIYDNGKEFEEGKLNADIVTNGAFRVFSVGQDGVTLDRAEHYWNRKEVKLERVRFVPTENAEKALEAYRAGEVDAVTNVEFEPLALKLLTPYDDFQRTTHSAINFYEFNREKSPFSDRRVREALAVAIERERLTEDEMEGASRPALSFLPFDGEHTAKIAQDAERARKLLAEAGFPNGENFPVVRLVINRNDTQQRIARRVAKMWKENLNVETDIQIKELAELQDVKKAGDYDVMRRGVVLPTSDETANMLAIFTPKKKIKESAGKKNQTAEEKKSETGENVQNEQTPAESVEAAIEESGDIMIEHLDENSPAILTEEEAILELPAIPLYFPTSYSLVKPYVHGFEINTLDAPSLKDVRIDNFWRPLSSNKNS